MKPASWRIGQLARNKKGDVQPSPFFFLILPS